MNHYKNINKKGWDYYFDGKSDTLIKLHENLKNVVKSRKKPDTIKYFSTQSIIRALNKLQYTRKNMAALRAESITGYQWFVIIFFALILIANISVIPSLNHLFFAIMKGAFAVATMVSVHLLYKLDKLELYNRNIGKKSSEDAVEIIKGKR